MADVKRGQAHWVDFDCTWEPDEPQNAFLVIRANPEVQLFLCDRPYPGILIFEKRANPIVSKDLEDRSDHQPVVMWSMRKWVRKTFCMRIPHTGAFLPAKVIDGYHRPYGGPHMWVSGAEDLEPWIELRWREPVPVREVHVTFNDDVNEDLINLHHHRTPFEIIPELVRDYRIEVWRHGRWEPAHAEKENRKRKRVHTFSGVRTNRLRIAVEATNGSPFAQIVEVRVYS